MTSVAHMLNPAAPLRTEEEARAAAGAGTVSLIISGLMSAAGAAMIVGRVDELKRAAMEEAARFADQSPNTAAMLQGMVESGMVEWAVALVAVWAAGQLLLAAVHWRRPGSFIPILFIVLLTYRLGDRMLGLAQGGEGGWATFATVILIVVCLVLHIQAVRGASRLAALRRAA